ncbi:MAG: peptidoglycan DD-metalloendopeptidase family protein [Deltaproteobacteria bacterium]|nr:peptidoglycan DD-metalloendopeptidase family protein [Deltaproteobacteria bacterium]
MFPFDETVFSKLIKITAACFLLLSTGYGTLLSAPQTLTGSITVDRVHVREKPDTQSAIIASLQKGASIAIHNHLNGWYEIIIHNQRGFVSDQFAKVPDTQTADEEDASQSRSLKDYNHIQHQVGKITRNIETRQAEVESYAQKEISVVALLDEIDRTLNTSRKLTATLHRDIETLKQKINETLSASEEFSIRIKTSDELAGKRLVALFKLDGVGRLNFLMSAETLQDWAHRKYLLQRILTFDERIFVRLQEDKKKLEVLYEKQKIQYEDKQHLEKLQADQIQSIEKEKSNRQKLLADIRIKKSREINAIETLKQAAEQLNATVETLEKGDTTPEPPTPMIGSDFISSKGLLQLPVKGRIISSFGKEIHSRLNVETFRNGIDIQADRGEPIQSVYAGQIIFAEWYKGYGNMVIINHGNHYYSVYAHLEEVLKSKGDRVETGEVIGTAGDTGSVTGAGLYFEVRHRGKPMDPLEWIKTG